MVDFARGGVEDLNSLYSVNLLYILGGIGTENRLFSGCPIGNESDLQSAVIFALLLD